LLLSTLFGDWIELELEGLNFESLLAQNQEPK